MLAIFILLVASVGLSAANQEALLVKNLLATLDQSGGRLARPVKNFADTMVVSHGITPLTATLHRGSLELTLWEHWTWNDPNLRWTPHEHGHVTSIRMNPRAVFMPDISVFNSRSKVEELQWAQLLVSSSGNVTLVQPRRFRTSCNNMTRRHPNRLFRIPLEAEKVNCDVIFGSWTYSTNMLDMKAPPAVSLQYLDPSHSSWSLQNVTAARHADRYPPFPDSYTTVKYTLTFTYHD